jgi:hypothetical protein
VRDVKASFPTANAGLRARLIAIAASAAIAASLSLLTTSASATIPGHTYASSFAGSGTNTLGLPVGIAVDNSTGASGGSVYIGDSVNKRVEKFNAAGNFLLMFGKGVNQTSGGDICPRLGFPADVCQAGTAGSGQGQFTNPRFIAVDWTSGPSSGSVYVLDPATQLIQKFSPSGNLITSWPSPAGGPLGGQLNGSSIPIFGAWTQAQGVAVDKNGNLHVLTLSNPTRIFTFTEGGAYVKSLLITSSPKPLGLSVDSFGNFLAGGPNGNGGEYKFSGTTGEAISQDFSQTYFGSYELAGRTVDVSPDPRRIDDYFVVSATTVNQYHWLQPEKFVQPDGSACYPGGSCGPISTFGSAQIGAATGVAVSLNSTVYVTDSSGNQVHVFNPIITPDTTNLSSSNVTPTTATVSGKVGLAGGGNVTDCYFEYGRTAS